MARGKVPSGFPVVDEEALFANAVPVSSLEEWQQALQDPSTQAIQVTATWSFLRRAFLTPSRCGSMKALR